MTDRVTRIDGVLAGLLKVEGVRGAALVARDGLPVRAVGALEAHRETFSAMAATILGAAEIVLAQVDGGNATTLVITAERAVLVLVGATQDLLLVASLSTPPEDLISTVRAAAAEVATIASG